MTPKNEGKRGFFNALGGTLAPFITFLDSTSFEVGVVFHVGFQTLLAQEVRVDGFTWDVFETFANHPINLTEQLVSLPDF